MLVECYDPTGKKMMKEAVDARECVERCGFTMEPPEKKEAPKKPTEKKDSKGKR